MQRIIDMVADHNEMVERVLALGDALLETYPDVEETEVNEAFCELHSKMVEMAIRVCCDANTEVTGWYTDEEWHVWHDEIFIPENMEKI